jgi:predicted ATPase
LPLIGRESELAVLKSRRDSSAKGKGRLVFLKGEAGMGKTRLLNELRIYCDAMGITFLQGRCYSASFPYSPWTEAINDCVRSTDAQTLTTHSTDANGCGSYHCQHRGLEDSRHRLLSRLNVKPAIVGLALAWAL